MNSELAFFTRHTKMVRHTISTLALLSIAYIVPNGHAQSLFPASLDSAQLPNNTVLQKGLNKPFTAPEFKGINIWLNSPQLTIQDLKGKVVLVDFWTYSCINCIHTLPHVTDWDQKYRNQGLMIVGIHTPEFEFEKTQDNVKTAIAKYGIHYPIALDNQYATWRNYNNRYWPAFYLIDKRGEVVYTHFGEGEYDVTEHNIRLLLGLSN